MPKTTTRTLKCRLDDADLLVRSQEWAAAVQHLQEKEAEAEKVARDYRKLIKDQEEKCNQLQEIVYNRHEERPVECEEVHDFAKRTVTLVRRDTLETVEARAMDNSELQIPMAFPPGAKEKLARAKEKLEATVADDAAAAGAAPEPRADHEGGTVVDAEVPALTDYQVEDLDRRADDDQALDAAPSREPNEDG